MISVQPLDVALKAALKGELEDVVLSLLMTPAQYDASLLKNAMKVTLFRGYIDKLHIFTLNLVNILNRQPLDLYIFSISQPHTHKI